MHSHVSCLLVFIILIGVSYADRQWTVSQDTYGTKVSSLVTAKYKVLLEQTEAFKPEAEACAAKVNSSVDKCVACLDTISCNSKPTAWLDELKKANPAYWGPKLESELAVLSNKIAAGVENLYNKYGKVAIEGLKDGFESIGQAFASLANIIGDGLKVAFQKIEDAFTDLWNKFSSIFGKRRRRSTMFAEASAVREKRSTITHEQQQCMSQCSDCSAFVSGDQETAMRAICGDSVVETNKTLAASLAQLQSFYTDWEGAEQDLLSEVWVNDAFKVTTVKALVGGVYKTLDASAENIVLDLWNQDPTYVAIAEFIYKQYA